MEVVLAAMGGAAVSAYMESVKEGHNPHPKECVASLPGKLASLFAAREMTEEERLAAFHEEERKRLQNEAKQKELAIARAKEKLGDMLTGDTLDGSAKDFMDEDILPFSEFLSLNPAGISKLFLANNQITEWGARAIATSLNGNYHCVKLNLRGNRLMDDGARSIAHFLRRNGALRELYLANNRISFRGATNLADALKHNLAVQILDLSYNDIGDEGARGISDMLIVNHEVKVLRLCLCHINDEGAKLMSLALDVNNSLEELDLSRNNITDIGALGVANGVYHNPYIRVVRLTANRLSDGAARAFAGCLSAGNAGHKLAELHLAHNSIREEGMATLVKAVENSKHLKVMTYVGNEITEDMEDQLMHILTRNNMTSVTVRSADEKLAMKALSGDLFEQDDFFDDEDEDAEPKSKEERERERLAMGLLTAEEEAALEAEEAAVRAAQEREQELETDADGNPVMGGDVDGVARAIEVDSFLSGEGERFTITQLEQLTQKPAADSIRMSATELYTPHAQQIAAFIAASQCLTSVDVCDNYLGDEAAVVLADGISASEAPLQTFKIGNNNIDDQGIVQLANALAGVVAPGVCEVDVSDNIFETEGSVQFCELMTGLDALHTLNMRYNCVGDAGAKALANLVLNSSSLKQLDVTCCDIHDEGLDALCEVLAKDGCTVETIFIGENAISLESKVKLTELVKQTGMTVEGVVLL